MPLTPEQVQELKAQLAQQVKHLPEEKRREAQQQIDLLSPEALESMLEQQRENRPVKSNKSIFRLIADKEIDTLPVAENKAALAVLDINPVSSGHTIIIPKKPIADPKQLPTAAFTLAKLIARKLARKLKAISTSIQSETKFGEAIIHVLPSYTSPVTLDSPRLKVTKDELEQTARKLQGPKRLPKAEKAPKREKQAIAPAFRTIRRIP